MNLIEEGQKEEGDLTTSETGTSLEEIDHLHVAMPMPKASQQL